MSKPSVQPDAQPCVWMSAGLLTYRLCDRAFDCERCPLDAALRGGPTPHADRTALSEPGAPTRDLPTDRWYGSGHTWLRRADHEHLVFRFGLDAFAATIAGGVCGIELDRSDRTLAPGSTVCEIDLGLGILRLGTPIAGRLVRGNPAVADRPSQVVTDPYRRGWLLEIAGTDPTDLRDLLTADQARDRTRLDLQRFRRRIALYLLAETSTVGTSLPDGGAAVRGLRQVLGGPRYLELLREFIH